MILDHLDLVTQRQTKRMQIMTWIRSGLYAINVWVAIYMIIKWYGSDLAGLGFMWAAWVVALQNFVASFFAYLYINISTIFQIWDIIKTWNPTMPCVWEVLAIWPFFTTIKELDTELLFTWRNISLPNNLIFTWWVFNYTENDLLFWHDMQVLCGVKNQSTAQALEHVTQIIHTIYDESLQDKTCYLHAQKHKPKIILELTDKWILFKISVLIHFYKIMETNNKILSWLIDWHKAGLITLVHHKDYEHIYD